jgi:carbonic anhydrase/acetyltransferase-like protein (isoleucine patch superfamily)
VFLADGVQIVGDVEIGEDSSVWFNSVIRGDVHWIRIGKRTNIQDGSVIHVTRDKYATLIGDEVTVGHGARIHGATLNDRCLIGVGAILLDRSVIGHDCIVAAGSIVTEGFEAPPRSLVMGCPAQVKRPLTEEEIARIGQTARNYLSYVALYREKC